ncbi:MAG: C40 family peptidase, partial [Eggerthellaceae bacterium]|nr:C40 family peptidase [Eggerthellaceae bacterium]
PDTSEPEASDTSDEPTSSEPEAWGPEQILKAAREAGLAGVDALEKWLHGGNLTDEELVSIDLGGLAGIDANLANEIRPAQEEARLRLEAKDKEAADDKSSKDSSDKADGKDKRKDDDANDESHPAWTYNGSTSNPPTPHGPNLGTAKFVAVIGESSRKLAGENDLYASVMIAQAIAESESGNAAMSQSPNYNLFGMKETNQGSFVSVSTQKGDSKDADHAEDVDYKKYPTYEASLQDYVDLLSGANYKSAHKSTTKSYVDACDYLEGTYSDSEQYSETLQELISAYDLTRYDEPLGYEVAGGSNANLSNLVILAADNLGKPYVWGATGPGGYDCSGLVVSTYSSALGMQLPRTTYFQCQQGEDVDFADLHMGDLLFFTNSKNEADHVAMYVGEGCYIESTSPGGVQVTALSEHMPTFAKRMVPTHVV